MSADKVYLLKVIRVISKDLRTKEMTVKRKDCLRGFWVEPTISFRRKNDYSFSMEKGQCGKVIVQNIAGLFLENWAELCAK